MSLRTGTGDSDRSTHSHTVQYYQRTQAFLCSSFINSLYLHSHFTPITFTAEDGVSSLAESVPEHKRITAQTARINLQRQEVHFSVLKYFSKKMIYGIQDSILYRSLQLFLLKAEKQNAVKHTLKIPK